jgi:histidinol-phosphate aminotransferase
MRKGRVPPPAAGLKRYRSIARRPLEPGPSGLWLDWNEASRPPSPRVFEQLAAFLSRGVIHRYPDPSASRLRRRLAAYTGRPVRQIQVFNGSDAALEHLVRTFVRRDDHVVVCAPSYDQFRVFGEALGAGVEMVRSPRPFRADLSHVLAALRPETRLVYVCNPDNPTGRTHTAAALARVARRLQSGLLVIDEAYHEYWGRTAAALIDRHENVVVSRSFSKAFALAGLRCGYLLGREPVLRQVDRIRNGKDVNVFAQIAAAAALEDLPAMRAWVAEVRRARAFLVRELRARGHEVVPSPANFVLLRASAAGALVRRLQRRGVHVRDRSDAPGLGPYIRVTVGTRDECRLFLAALDAAQAGT